MGNLILVDSNIIIFALDSKNNKYIPARDFLEDRNLKPVIAHHNLLEIYRVITNKKHSNPLSAKKALKIINGIVEKRVIISPKLETMQVAQKLITRHLLVSNKIFDAYLAATTISWGVENIATDNDKDFVKFKEIKTYNQFK